MKLISLITVCIYCGVSLFVAVRLLLLAKRTRELPELMIGCAYLAGGMIGYPFAVVANVLVEASKPEAAEVAAVIGQLGMASSAFFLLISWRRIFAPMSRGALVFVVGWTFFILVSLSATLLEVSPSSSERLINPIYWSLLIAQGGCYAILAGASFRHSRMLLRRCAIGLADPVIANRIFLWGCSAAMIAGSYTYASCAGVMLRNGMMNIYEPVVVALLGLISVCSVTLAFFPPHAYLAWIRANAPAAEDA